MASVTTTSTVASVTTAVHQTNSIESAVPRPQIMIESTIAQSVDLAKTIHKAANVIKSIISSLSVNNPAQPGQSSVFSQNKIQEVQQLIEVIEQNSKKVLKLGEFILKVSQVLKEFGTSSSSEKSVEDLL